jgi:flagellar motor switch protein FliN/FliY
MADDEQIGQDEIEELLRQSQQAKPAPKPATAAPAAADTASLGQDEIEALLGKGGPPPAPAKPAAAASSAAAPVPPAPMRQPVAALPPKGRSVGDDVNLLLAQAEAAIASVDQPTAAELKGLSAFELHDFAGTPANTEKATIELLRDVELDLKIELGRTHMYLEDVLKLRKGSVVSLDKLAGDPVDIYVNGRLIARGEVLVLNDNFCVRVAELLAGEEAA